MGAETTPATSALAPPGELRPLLAGRREAARLLGLSLRALDRANASGTIPAPIRLGGRPLWRLTELESWVLAGAPGRPVWERMRGRKK